MDKNELERRLEAAEKQNLGLLDEIKNLKEKLAEMQDDPEIPDETFFRANETYWRMYPTLRHIKSSVLSSDYVGECFNMFHTKEYANEFADKCELIAMMLHCKWHIDRDYVPDWNNHNEEKFYMLFNHDSHEFIICSCGSRFVDGGLVFFSTAENAQRCADWLNKHYRENADE